MKIKNKCCCIFFYTIQWNICHLRSSDKCLIFLFWTFQVYNQLKAIIVKLLAAYPQQSLWMMLCVLKSSYPARVARCEQVLADARLKPLGKLVRDFKQLAEKLIELCNKPIAGKVMVGLTDGIYRL